MTTSRFTVALGLAFVGAFAALAFSAPESRLTSAQAEEMLRAHNTVRSGAGVPPVEWSADLVRRAQGRADHLAARGCRLSHAGLPKGLGENLFGATPIRTEGEDDRVGEFTPTQVVDLWARERSDYDYSRNRCARGKQCAHYTQIVWRSTKEVGCAMTVCPSRGQVWACNYRPAGNVVGQKPY